MDVIQKSGHNWLHFLNLFYQKEDQWLKWSMRLIEGPEPHAAVENDDGLVKYIASTKVCHRLKGSVMLNVTLKVFWISTLGKCIMNRIKTGVEHRRKWNGTFCLFLNWRCWSTIPDYSSLTPNSHWDLHDSCDELRSKFVRLAFTVVCLFWVPLKLDKLFLLANTTHFALCAVLQSTAFVWENKRFI